MNGMNKNHRETSKRVMVLAWQFVKKNGYSMREAMLAAWKNIKLQAALHLGIVKFYFQKIDGTIREAYGTLKENLISTEVKGGNRKMNESIQTYFDTEKQEFRCFKKANLLRIA